MNRATKSIFYYYYYFKTSLDGAASSRETIDTTQCRSINIGDLATYHRQHARWTVVVRRVQGISLPI